MRQIPIKMTFFFQLHPIIATIFFGELIVLTMLFNHVAVALTGIVSLMIINVFYLGRHAAWQQLKFNGVLFFMIVFFNVLLNQKFSPFLWKVSTGFFTFKLSYPALLYGITMGIMLTEMLMTFALLNTILTANKLIYVFAPITPKLALLVTISFNLVRDLIKQFGQLLLLQKTRNLDTTTGSLPTRLKKILSLFQILLEDSLSSAMETANLMDARGFGAAKRTHYRSYRFNPTDWFFLMGTTAAFALLLFVRINAMGWTNSVADFNTILFTGDLYPMVLLGSFTLLPLIAEGVYHLWTN